MLIQRARPTAISAIATLIVAGAATLSVRHSLISADVAPAVVATETSVRLRWSVAAVLATLVAVPALLLLAFLVRRLRSPWRASLGFVLYLLSPVLALLTALAFHALVAPPPSPIPFDIPAVPGPLFVFPPVVFGVGALLLIGFGRSPSHGPA